MRMRDVFATTAGGLTAVAGIVAAVLCPIGGMVAGGYFVYGAVAATMGTGATVALTAAGAVGGLVLGKIAAPFVGLAGVAAGGLVGGAISLLGHAAEKAGSFLMKPFRRNQEKTTRLTIDIHRFDDGAQEQWKMPENSASSSFRTAGRSRGQAAARPPRKPSRGIDL